MVTVDDAALAELLALAGTARGHAWAPYSRFLVGAVVRGTSGRLYTGCNVENASYPLTCCAERTALYKAVSEGETQVDLVVVVTDTSPPASPCGGCRQVILELGPEATVIYANLQGDHRRTTARALLPDGFESHQLPR